MRIDRFTNNDKLSSITGVPLRREYHFFGGIVISIAINGDCELGFTDSSIRPIILSRWQAKQTLKHLRKERT